MKVVSCKNCGAKYQIDDGEDISTYECSSCSGELELLNNESSPIETEDYISTGTDYFDSIIVQCKECGLKYSINNNENILDYECDSCGGSLRYVDKDMNNELEAYLKERKSQQIPIKPIVEEHNNENINKKPPSLLGSMQNISSRFDTFFSEERIEEEYSSKEELKKPKKTARVSVPESVMNEFGREFNIPQSTNYATLKKYLKNEFFKGIEEYYTFENNMITNKAFKSFSNKLANPNEKTEDNSESFISKISNLTMNDISIIIGIIFFIIGICEIFFINTGIGFVLLIVGVILICVGLYKSKDEEDKKTEKRTRIVREHLLNLPDDYYVFYNVRLPNSYSGINHLVIGPTGIYSLLSKKYDSNKTIEIENSHLTQEDKNKIEHYASNMKSKFRYRTNDIKFNKDNEIKQKAIKLGENLINFLNENNIRNYFVEPLVGFVNNQVVVINMPLTDEDLFIEELIMKIKTDTVKLDRETIDKCAVLINKYSADCSAEL